MVRALMLPFLVAVTGDIMSDGVICVRKACPHPAGLF